MSSETNEEPRMQGPMPSGAWMARHRERLNEAEQASSRADTARFISQVTIKAEEEVKRWSSVACGGQVDRLSRCDDACASVCPERAHVMCPRRQVRRMSQEEAMRQRERRAELEKANVSPRTLEAVFDAEPWDTEATKGLAAALNMTPKPTIIVLQGGVGCGKSCAAALWAVRSEARWITAKAFARLGYDAEVELLGRCKALVLDDLGTEYADGKGFFQSNLDGLIDDRYSRKLATVITTNVPFDEFKARYQDRISDRLREAGQFVEVAGGSLRRWP